MIVRRHWSFIAGAVCAMIPTMAPTARSMGAPPPATVDDRVIVRHPAVSRATIVFVAGGDLWTVGKSGGTATRLTHRPSDRQSPRFSPDESTIAFGADYDGTLSLYTMPAAGGTEHRVTYYPSPDRLMEWSADGRSLLFNSARVAPDDRSSQLFEIPASGGLAHRLPLRHARQGARRPGGTSLAYVEELPPLFRGYRGGTSAHVRLLDLRTKRSHPLSTGSGNDAYPMWHGDILYVVSDRDASRHGNIWAMDTKSGAMRQVTHFTDFDVADPSIGPDALVFQVAGQLYIMDLATERIRAVPVRVALDDALLAPRRQSVGGLASNMSPSPHGDAVAIEARGEVFTIGADTADVRNLTNSSGVAERMPAWSPDGTQLAYWSDRSGDYELYVRAADGTGGERRLTSYGAGYRYRPYWSPDGAHIAYIDAAMMIRVVDVASGATQDVDREFFDGEFQRREFAVAWSPDGRLLAYSKELPTRHSAIALFDVRHSRRLQVTTGYYHDVGPVFDAAGDLYFLSDRALTLPTFGDVDAFVFANPTKVFGLARGAFADADSASLRTSDVPAQEIERRAFSLPVRAGYYAGMQFAAGKLMFIRAGATSYSSNIGAGFDGPTPLIAYDLVAKTEVVVLDNADDFIVSADARHVLVKVGANAGVVEVSAGQRVTALPTARLIATVDPRAEWRQIFADAWRFERDMFYDPGMNGVDWTAARAQYEPLVGRATTRWDIDFILKALLTELRTSHVATVGGDYGPPRRRQVGLLGVDWDVDRGTYRIAHVVDGAAWDTDLRSPLQGNPLVKAGDYVIAVNGTSLDVAREPYAAFEGLANRPIELLVNDSATTQGARTVTVQPLASEHALRQHQWIEANRHEVERRSGGRVGYVDLRNTMGPGLAEFVRGFRAQLDKPALLVDDRYNQGGEVPDRFIELLRRKPAAAFATRAGGDWQIPPYAASGPTAMLVNGWAVSGGEALPYLFREAGLGRLVGSRTFGGLVEVTGQPALIDGGSVRVPTGRVFGKDGRWYPEGYGLTPDVQVDWDDIEPAPGRDRQLAAAVDLLLRSLVSHPQARLRRPR